MELSAVLPEPASRADSSDRVHVSVVVPVYGCEGCLVELCARLVRALEPITPSFEIILVNDASPDASWRVIRSLAEGDSRVKGINLSRNFGQHYALAAGIDHAEGSWVVVMDCDLQHAPEDIPTLYRKAQEGYDVVFSRRLRRKDPLFKRVNARLFNAVLGYLTGSKLDSAISNFSIVSRGVVTKLRAFRERNRSYPLFLKWLGFETAIVDVEHADRFAGKSTYTLSKQVAFAIESIVSQSDKPLRLSIRLGFLVALAAALFGTYLILRYLLWAVPAAGWTSVVVSIYFVGGILLVNMGVLGLYIGKIFDETKARPLYIVKELVNLSGTPPIAHRRSSSFAEVRRASDS